MNTKARKMRLSAESHDRAADSCADSVGSMDLSVVALRAMEGDSYQQAANWLEAESSRQAILAAGYRAIAIVKRKNAAAFEKAGV